MVPNSEPLRRAIRPVRVSEVGCRTLVSGRGTNGCAGTPTLTWRHTEVQQETCYNVLASRRFSYLFSQVCTLYGPGEIRDIFINYTGVLTVPALNPGKGGRQKFIEVKLSFGCKHPSVDSGKCLTTLVTYHFCHVVID